MIIFKPSIRNYFESVENLEVLDVPQICQTVFSKNGFRERVWKEIYFHLPFGKTFTYGEVARKCGSPGASQVNIFISLESLTFDRLQLDTDELRCDNNCISNF